jgi:importin-9
VNDNRQKVFYNSMNSSQVSFLKAIVNCLEFCLSLLFSQQQNIPVEHKQLAALTLKKYIDTHWTTRSENFCHPEVPFEVKQVLRSSIIRILSERHSKIRHAISYCVATIAHYDWPDLWPQFLPELFSLTASSDINAVDGAIRVFSGIALLLRLTLRFCN